MTFPASAPLAASHTSPPVFPVVLFLVLGLVAAVFGVALVLDVRSVATRKAKRVRDRNSLLRTGSGRSGGAWTMWGSPGYFRFLGGVALVAGVVLLVAGGALSRVG